MYSTDPSQKVDPSQYNSVSTNIGFKSASELLSSSNQYDRTTFFGNTKREFNTVADAEYQPVFKLSFPGQCLKGQTIKQRDTSVKKLKEALSGQVANEW